jgi:hypothetical protein
MYSLYKNEYRISKLDETAIRDKDRKKIED